MVMNLIEKILDSILDWLWYARDKKWFYPLCYGSIIIILIPVISYGHQRDMQNNKLLRGKLVLLFIDNQKLLINEYQLRKLRNLISHPLTLQCGDKVFVISPSKSFQYKKKNQNDVPKDIVICSDLK
ncbi:MAG: hypothetical protein AB4063_17210 [Crocosphaera sp.]